MYTHLLMNLEKLQEVYSLLSDTRIKRMISFDLGGLVWGRGGSGLTL